MKTPLFNVTKANGLSDSPSGAHMSRTMMLAELRLLFAACPPTASLADYQAASIDDNVLLKDTQTTRARTVKILRELYALDRSTIIFHALRDLWEADAEAQPLLALLCAGVRDRLLRASSSVILAASPGAIVTPQALAEAAQGQATGQYNVTTLGTIGRNLASSWTQSGHLQGHTMKVRAQAMSRPAAVAYALLLSHLAGARGDALFETLWARLLDAPLHIMREQAMAASRLGWIEYRHAGGVTDITFRHLLREERGEARP